MYSILGMDWRWNLVGRGDYCVEEVRLKDGEDWYLWNTGGRN